MSVENHMDINNRSLFYEKYTFTFYGIVLPNQALCPNLYGIVLDYIFNFYFLVGGSQLHH